MPASGKKPIPLRGGDKDRPAAFESLGEPPPAAGPRAEFLAGAAAILPVLVAASPFGLLLGALGAAKGLSPLEVGLMSGLVFAGGAQFVALDLWRTPAPWLTLGFAVLIVNLRHVLMGASIQRRMGGFPMWGKIAALMVLADEIWAFAEERAARTALTPAYYAGLGVTLYVGWLMFTVGGCLVGALIGDPAAYGFDFAFAATFIGLLAGFRSRPGFVPAVLASIAAAVAVHLAMPGPASIAAGAVAGVSAAFLSGRDDGNGETHT